MTVGQHEDPGFAGDTALAQDVNHGPEEGDRLVDGAAHHHVGVALLHGPNAEAARLGYEAMGRCQVHGTAFRLGEGQAGGGELLQQVGPGGGIHEGTLGQGVLHPIPPQAVRFAFRQGPHLRLRGEEDGADEPAQVAHRFEGSGIQGLREHHRGAVPGGGQQAAVEGRFDVKHGTPDGHGGTCHRGSLPGAVPESPLADLDGHHKRVRRRRAGITFQLLQL